MRYEYKVVPAPTKPQKAPRIKGAEAKFAHGLESVMNTYAADGWEYQRADILPSEERRGLRSSQTVYRTVLVFRRAVDDAQTMSEMPADTPAAQAVPDVHAPEPVADYEASEAEHVTEAERRSRFSLVGPARRGSDAAAPPLAAPHVVDERRADTDHSDDGR